MRFIQELKLGYVFLLALTIRVFGAFWFGIPAFPDSIEYYEAGARFFEYGSFYNHKIMPLYPFLSYFSMKVFGFYMIDILLSACSVFLVYQISHSLFSDKFLAKLSALVFAVYPFSIFYANSGLTETSFVFCMLVAMSALYQRKTFLGILFLVLTVLIRPSLDLINPLIVLCFCIFVYKGSMLFTIKQILKYALVYIFLMTPWWIYNTNQYGQFVRLNLGAGEMLYGGNNPKNIDGRASEEALDFSKFKHISDLSERDQALKKEAVHYILNNKADFISRSMKRLVAFWNIFPNHEKHRTPAIMTVSGISILSLYFGSLFFLFLGDRRLLKRCIPLFLIIIYLSAIHTVTIGSVRYRYPLEPFLIMFLAFSMAYLFGRKLETTK